MPEREDLDRARVLLTEALESAKGAQKAPLARELRQLWARLRELDAENAGGDDEFTRARRERGARQAGS